jgi:hypothetical protein
VTSSCEERKKERKACLLTREEEEETMFCWIRRERETRSGANERTINDVKPEHRSDEDDQWNSEPEPRW